MTLAELEVGDSAVIIDIDTRPETKRRLMDIGLARGTEIRVKRFAPLGDPMEIALKDFSLALRKSDAVHILVKAVQHSVTQSALTTVQRADRFGAAESKREKCKAVWFRRSK